MSLYRLWNDGKVIELNLDADPRDGDVIKHEEKEYTVSGRRFEDGKLHYAVQGEPKSQYEDPHFSLSGRK